MILLDLHASTTSILVLGLVFHLLYILSVFDCYFTSPVVHGMRHFSAGIKDAPAPAKRLVLFVGTSILVMTVSETDMLRFTVRVWYEADGLRADLLYNLNPFPTIPNSPEVVAPYLRDIVLERGAFGVAHTHVPTESRPGHVALIGTHFTFAHYVLYRP